LAGARRVRATAELLVTESFTEQARADAARHAAVARAAELTCTQLLAERCPRCTPGERQCLVGAPAPPRVLRPAGRQRPSPGAATWRRPMRRRERGAICGTSSVTSISS
jgi:hypothetical protein